MARIRWAKQKKRPKSRRSGSKQPAPGVGFLAKKAPVYLILFLIFGCSKEIFSYDEEFIIIICLFTVFLVLVEGLKNQVVFFFARGLESLNEYYMEHFLFTKWALLLMKRGLRKCYKMILAFSFLFVHYKNLMFYLTSYNFFLKKLYISLIIKETLTVFLLYEDLLYRNFYDFVNNLMLPKEFKNFLELRGEYLKQLYNK